MGQKRKLAQGKSRRAAHDKQVARAVAGTPKTKNLRVMSGGRIEAQEAQVVIRKTPIVWGVPCDEVMYATFFQYFVKHANFMPWDGWAISESTYIPKARNFIHNAFLLESDLPYLMMLDSDILFPPNIVGRLMAHKKPISGGWYRNKKEEGNPPVVFDFYAKDDGTEGIRNREQGKGLEQVDAMGAGCFLMTRECAEALGESPYTLNTGSNWGEDMLLCLRLREKGIPLHVDWDMPLAHVGVFHV